MSDIQKQQLFSNITEAMSGVPERIMLLQPEHFYKADPAYGTGVVKKLGMDLDKVIAWSDLPLDGLIQVTSTDACPGT